MSLPNQSHSTFSLFNFNHATISFDLVVAPDSTTPAEQRRHIVPTVTPLSVVMCARRLAHPNLIINFASQEDCIQKLPDHQFPRMSPNDIAANWLDFFMPKWRCQAGLYRFLNIIPFHYCVRSSLNCHTYCGYMYHACHYGFQQLLLQITRKTGVQYTKTFSALSAKVLLAELSESRLVTVHQRDFLYPSPERF